MRIIILSFFQIIRWSKMAAPQGLGPGQQGGWGLLPPLINVPLQGPEIHGRNFFGKKILKI